MPVPMAATMAEAIPVPEAGTSSIAPAAEPSPPVKAQPVVVAEAVVVPPPLQVPVARRPGLSQARRKAGTYAVFD